MEEMIRELSEAFDIYRSELEKSLKKTKITDGLFGFGHGIKDDACHSRLDETVGELAGRIAEDGPAPEDAERAIRELLCREDRRNWINEAQWMLRAVERHAIQLIPFLTPETAGVWLKKYTAAYKPWDRLPAQNSVVKALKERSRA